MDGKTLLWSLREILQESSSSTFLSDRVSYSYLYEAACEFTTRTECLTTTQSITTVANQSAYTVSADFMRLYLKDDYNRYYIKYNDGSNDYFIFYKDYEDIVYSNNTTSQSIPDRFAIVDASAISRISGTVSSSGSLSNGECTLTDSTADFTNVGVGDSVHNTTDDSHGIIISKTSTTALVTCLFDGTDNDWDSSDAYMIVPQGRFRLILDPPLSTASHTITLYYVQKPDPVFSPYRAYRFKSDYVPAIVKYAAFLYKYRDLKPDYGDAFYKYFDLQTRKADHDLNSTLRRKGFRVNLIKK